MKYVFIKQLPQLTYANLNQSADSAVADVACENGKFICIINMCAIVSLNLSGLK